MGSKKKFWYQPSKDPSSPWLFKYPHGGAGQHWAEKIAAEVASLLQVPHATVELATYKGAYGSVTKSFATEGKSLHHGNQLLEIVLHDYDGTMTYNQSDHTLTNILTCFPTNCIQGESAEDWLEQSARLVSGRAAR
jgi:hypothetical protein